MIKYLDTSVTLREVPDEISLCINITNCVHACKGCHSPELRKNIGNELDYDTLDNLIKENKGTTCICLMGEGNDRDALLDLLIHIRIYHKHKKVCLYTGNDVCDYDFIRYLDYVKTGPYKEEYGSLDCSTTNQKFYSIDRISYRMEDITYKFQKLNDNEN